MTREALFTAVLVAACRPTAVTPPMPTSSAHAQQPAPDVPHADAAAQLVDVQDARDVARPDATPAAVTPPVDRWTPVAPPGTHALALPDEDCGDVTLGPAGRTARLCRAYHAQGGFRWTELTIALHDAPPRAAPALRLHLSSHPMDAPTAAASAYVVLALFVGDDGSLAVTDHPRWPCAGVEARVTLPASRRWLVARPCAARGRYVLRGGAYVRDDTP